MTILERTDTDPPLFYADEISVWPAHCREQWVGNGLLAMTTPASVALCTNCDLGYTEEVVYLEDDGDKRAYIQCPVCGPIRIDVNQLMRWEVDLAKLISLLVAELQCRGPTTELTPRRFWHLGEACIGSRWRDVFFARLLFDNNGCDAIFQNHVPASSVVFVPCRKPFLYANARDDEHFKVLVVSLAAALLLDGQRLYLDRAYIENQLLARAPLKTTRPKAKKSSVRVTLIVALTEEMIKHIRSAYEYARNTEEQSGTPQLLPRPTQRQLAKLVGTSQANVNRCMTDSSARELRFLWDMAVDLDRIMLYGGRNVNF